MNIGTTDISKIYKGTSEVTKIYKGATEIYSGETYCAEALLLFNRLTGDQPSTALKELINTTIEGLKTDGVFVLGDGLYVRGVHTAELACQNWIKNAHNSTLVNSPVFTPKVGFKGDGSTNYIDNNYNVKDNAVNFDTESATIALMSTQVGTVNTKLVLGATEGDNRQYIYSYASVSDRVYLFSSAYVNPLKFGNDEYATWVRDTGKIQGYKNGVTVGGNTTNALVGIKADRSMYELAGNTATGVASPWNGSLSFTFYGGKLTGTQVAALYNRIKYFYDNVGGTF